ncbi:cytochrome P450 [Daedaleopsis nitida]|nr:cytochrome P450 [Daedaleopsis nitida]
MSLLAVLVCFVALLAYSLYSWTIVPSHLRHKPTVPLLPLLLSYLRGEVEEQRVKRLVLPFAHRARTNVVVVFSLGEWIVHVVDGKIGRQLLENRSVRKHQPPPEMLLWHLTGRDNVFMSEGEMWKRHSRVVRDALHRKVPIAEFVHLPRKTFSLMGKGGRVRWNDYTHCRFTLDAVGTTVIGYDFEALDKPDGSFVRQYHDVMEAIANPPYIFIPSLERWLPRNNVRKVVDDFIDRFRVLLELKRKEPGDDMITYMFEDPEMSETEFRDNVIITFIAGHDTTAGALSSFVFYLGDHQDVQERVRQEVLSVMGQDEPRIEHFAKMPYLHAVICEALRLNNPSNITIPRIADIPLQAGDYTIPPRAPFVLNMCACPARMFSLYEQRVLISMLLREYRWTVPRDSIHVGGNIKNAFSPFALSLPYDVDIDFEPLL